MVWPAATEKKQVKAQQRMQAMLHHDKMPEGKHVKYLQHGPRPSRSGAAEERRASHETAHDISSQSPGPFLKQTTSKGSSSWLVEEEVAV